MSALAETHGHGSLVSVAPDAARWQQLAETHGTPLLAFDRTVLADQYRRFSEALPRVQLFYALKALADPQVIEAVDALGGNFDVASAGEAALLRDAGISGRRTIHTHPIKKDSEIRAALRFGATTFVVDSAEELTKLVPYRNRVGVLLRLAFDNDETEIALSRKFGCAPSEVLDILKTSARLGIHIKGLSFHVGSQCRSPAAHLRAIDASAELLREAETSGVSGRAAPPAVLDIGGGFPVPYTDGAPTIEAFCAPIQERLVGLPVDWHLIAEPGRALIAPAVTGVFSVAGRSTRGKARWYYLDDGVYGAFSGIIFDHVRYPLALTREGLRYLSVLAGPTCDSIDVIDEDLLLPELEVGDLVIGRQMGAYTLATSTSFNSLPPARLVTVPGATTGPLEEIS